MIPKYWFARRANKLLGMICPPSDWFANRWWANTVSTPARLSQNLLDSTKTCVEVPEGNCTLWVVLQKEWERLNTHWVQWRWLGVMCWRQTQHFWLLFQFDRRWSKGFLGNRENSQWLCQLVRLNTLLSQPQSKRFCISVSPWMKWVLDIRMICLWYLKIIKVQLLLPKTQWTAKDQNILISDTTSYVQSWTGTNLCWSTYIYTVEMLADLMTKPATKSQLNKFKILSFWKISIFR